MNPYKKYLKKIIAGTTTTTLVFMGIPAILFTGVQTASAAVITVTDIQSSLKAGDLSNHDFYFSNKSIIHPGETITITFSPGTVIDPGFTSTDAVLVINSTAQSLANTSSSLNWGIARNSATMLTLTVPSGISPIAANTDFGLHIGVAGGNFGSTVKKIDAGEFTTCALKTDDSVMCWGENSYGMLGDGTNNPSNIPVQVDGLGPGTVKDITVGYVNACALKMDNSVVCWGYGGLGELGNGTFLNSNVPVQVSGLDGVGSNAVSKISLNYRTGCAVKTDGSAVCWGYNSQGQLGNGNQIDSNVPLQIPGLTSSTTKNITNGTQHVCALKIDDSVVCWGYDNYGQLGRGSSPTPPGTPEQVVGLDGIGSNAVKKISSGYNHVCVIKADDSAWCWGKGDYGQLGNNGVSPSTSPVQVFSLTAGTAKDISAGGEHSCVIKMDSSAWCWGFNGQGQLGNGSIGPQTVPTQVTGLIMDSSLSVTTGWAHSCDIQINGSAVCWGYNGSGQLGDGTLVSSIVYVPVTGLTSSTHQVRNSEDTGVQTYRIGGTIADSGYTSVYIVVDDAVKISANVLQTLTFNISTSTVNFGVLDSNGPRYATPPSSNGSSSDTIAHSLSVSTNATGGYVISLRGNTLTSQQNSVNTITPNITPTTSATGTEQFGISATSTGGLNAVIDPEFATLDTFGFNSTATTSVTFASGSTPTDTTTFNLHYLANIAPLTEAGSYSTNLIYLATASF